MRSITKVLGVLCMLLFLNQHWIWSQDTDFETWSSIGLEFKATKKLSFGVEQHLRLKTNSSEIDTYFTQLEGSYFLFNGFALGSGLRYIRKNDTKGKIQGYENHFRFHIDASYKHKINRFSLKYRLRYQNKNELEVSSDEGDYAKQHIRLKASVDYAINNWKLDPKIAMELFNQFGEEDQGLSKLRWTLSTDYKLKKLGKLKLFYSVEKDLNTPVSRIVNILGFKYTYTLKTKKSN